MDKELKYKINVDTQDLINIYVKEWVLEWCKKYHPEAFDSARKFVNEAFEEQEIKNSEK